MWYLVGILVAWVGFSLWGVFRANDTEAKEIIETVTISFLLSLVWPITIIGGGISYGLFTLVNRKKEIGNGK